MASVFAQYRRRALLTLSLATGFSVGLVITAHADGATSSSPAKAIPSDAVKGSVAGGSAHDPPDAASADEESILVLPPADPQAVLAALRAVPSTTLAAGERAAPPQQSNVTVRKFQHLQWSPDRHHFHAQGHVQIFYQNLADPKDTGMTLTSQDVEVDTDTGQLEAQDGVRIERTDGTITGQQAKYNFNSRSGYITDAIAETAYFRMRGKRIETQANGAYVVYDGVFTTCLHNRPDYQIHAKRLTVSPNRYVSARGITFYAGPTHLISLPSYRRSLSTNDQPPVPTPGYDKVDGVTIRLQDNPISQPHQALNYDLRFNIREWPTGIVAYQSDLSHPRSSLTPSILLPGLTDPLRGYLEQLNPPTYREYVGDRLDEEREPRISFFGVLQARQFVYNRRINDLVLSRYPELGVRFTNLLGHNRPPLPTGPNSTPLESVAQPVGSTEAAIQRIPNAPFLLDVSASVGEFNEQPTNIAAGRFGLRADAASQPILIGKRLSWRLGASDWFNAYTSGTTYDLLSVETELNYVPTRTSVFGAGYRYLTDAGTTPFSFDRRDIRHELRLRYQVGGPWAFGVLTKFDLERSRVFDSEFAVVRNFDCMQVGVEYRLRTQSFEIIFNLLPPTPDREQRMRTFPIVNPAPSPTANAASKG